MALDEADVKRIGELIKEAIKPEIIGQVVKAHLDGLKLDEKIKEAVATGTKDLREKVDAADKGDKGDKDKDKSKSGEKGADDDRLAAMQRQIDERDRKLAEAESRQAAEALDAAARDALIKAGVPAERVPHALPFLKTAGVLVSKDGKPGWKGKDRFGVDATLSLDEGAAAWAQTPDGKLYLPPSGVNGTGEKAAGVGANAGAGPVKLSSLTGSVLGFLNAAQQ